MYLVSCYPASRSQLWGRNCPLSGQSPQPLGILLAVTPPRPRGVKEPRQEPVHTLPVAQGLSWGGHARGLSEQDGFSCCKRCSVVRETEVKC